MNANANTAVNKTVLVTLGLEVKYFGMYCSIMSISINIETKSRNYIAQIGMILINKHENKKLISPHISIFHPIFYVFAPK